MGFSSSGACFPTQQAALDHWCASLTPGAYASSCNSCSAATGECSVTHLLSDSTAATVALPVNTPACEVPNPVADSVTFVGAVVALWVLAWAGHAVYAFFKVPHHE